MVIIVKTADSDEGGKFIAAVDKACLSEDAECETFVSFDCEGVNLSRLGTLEIISLCLLYTIPSSSSSASASSALSISFREGHLSY
jgi:hypothetical protein